MALAMSKCVLQACRLAGPSWMRQRIITKIKSATFEIYMIETPLTWHHLCQFTALALSKCVSWPPGLYEALGTKPRQSESAALRSWSEWHWGTQIHFSSSREASKRRVDCEKGWWACPAKAERERLQPFQADCLPLPRPWKGHQIKQTASSCTDPRSACSGWGVWGASGQTTPEHLKKWRESNDCHPSNFDQLRTFMGSLNLGNIERGTLHSRWRVGGAWGVFGRLDGLPNTWRNEGQKNERHPSNLDHLCIVNSY